MIPVFSSVRRAAAAALVLLTTACSQAAIEASFVPSPDLWERWAAHDATSTGTVEHETWNDLLQKYVSTGAGGLNRFAYRRVSAFDRKRLDEYIASLERIRITHYARPEQFAFWANLYNAVTVRTVLDAYPVDSIRDINDGFLSAGPWARKLTQVEGVPLSLDEIEHRILRPIWRDARIHYAVNCAAAGCPNLQKAAFTGAGLSAALDRAAAEYINSPHGVRIAPDGTLTVSSIYIWFEEDFGGGRAGVIDHLRRHAVPALRPRLTGPASITGYAYDWALNDER